MTVDVEVGAPCTTIRRLRRTLPQAGASGFVLKEAAEDELLQAIRLAAAGDTHLHPRVGARLPSEP